MLYGIHGIYVENVTLGFKMKKEEKKKRIQTNSKERIIVHLILIDVRYIKVIFLFHVWYWFRLRQRKEWQQRKNNNFYLQ